MRDRYELARDASVLRMDLGLDAHSPIDMFEVVKNIDGLKVIYEPMSEVLNAFWIKEENITTIVVNSDESIEQQSFVLAHQLYHYFYESGIDEYICGKVTETDSEKEADLFAFLFLITPTALLDTIRKYDGKDNSCIEDLMKHFNMNREDVDARLAIEKIAT